MPGTSEFDNLQPYKADPFNWGLVGDWAERGQQRQDKASDELYKLQGMIGSVNAIDEHKPIKQQLDNKYYQQLSGVSDQLAQGNTQGALNALRKTQYQWYADPERQELENSYANNQAYQKKRIELGDKYAPWEDVSHQNFTGINPDGTPQPYRFTGMGQVEDHYGKAKEMIEGLKPSGQEAKAFNLDESGDIINIKKGQEGIASSWLRKVSDLKAPDFLNTKEGQGWFKEMHYKGMDPNNLHKEASNYLYRTGINQLFSKGTSDASFEYAPKDIRKDTTPLGTQSTNISGIKVPGSEDLKPSNELQTITIPGSITPVPILTQKPFNDDQKKALSEAQKEYGDYSSDATSQAKLLNKYLDYHNNTLTYPGLRQYDPTDKKAFETGERETKFYFGNGDKSSTGAANTREFKLISGSGDHKISGEDFTKKYGDPTKYETKVSGNLTPDQPWYSAGRMATVFDKDGKQVATYAMKGSNEETNNPVNNVLHGMYQAKYNPTHEQSITLPTVENGKNTNKEFKVKYENITSGTLDNNNDPVVIGHTAELIDAKTGKSVHKVSFDDPNTDVIQALFQTLPR